MLSAVPRSRLYANISAKLARSYASEANFRTEHDTMGAIQVPSEKLWGAQTQRSLQNFVVGDCAAERMPEPLIKALGSIKKAAAVVNHRVGNLQQEMANAIVQAASEVSEGKLVEHFPLIVWQTGSATQTNMNANEVIANRATRILAEAVKQQLKIHPNDHVNMGQSSNDTIPTAMHVAAAQELNTKLLPALKNLHAALLAKVQAFGGIVKVGRTHAQDATPLTLGQEFSGYTAQIELGIKRVESVLPDIYCLAQGGTAVGTGLNTFEGFDAAIVRQIAEDTGLPFTPSPNKFESLAAHDALVMGHGALNTLAASLMKIGNDLRLLGSGPRCGIGELALPANEPGSSIMPGKVNPTQCEMLTMVCCQVMGNHVAVTMAGSSGLWELNAFKPVIIANFLRSTRLLADACEGFRAHCVEGLQANQAKIAQYLDNSLMMVTALAPSVGYEKAAAIAKKALADDVSLKTAAVGLGVSVEEFERVVVPGKMLGPNKPRK